MKDAEFIYSLYVQANPVPDPDLLPPTRDEAVLLTTQRSLDMINEEQTNKNLAQPPKRKRPAVALGAAAVLIVAVAAVAILVDGGSGAVVAADADPVVVFDGTTCSYDGPMLIEEGLVGFTLTSSGDEGFSLIGIRMEEPTLSQELAFGPVGSDWATTPATPTPEGQISMAGVSAGDSTVNAFLMKAGAYVLDCAIPVRAQPEHLWRIAQIEVVEP